ncbi:MAG: nitrogenase iron protein [Deltaproteobacteria bacterium]|nr:MAG: nitrogenase iron protein [Deltaproteobacteria bacterium]
MERLVFYGKGGIGKSTISANMAACFAGLGYRVLHVGCDPKHDSTVALMDGEMIPTVVDRSYRDIIGPEDIVSLSRSGVHCVEAGGPAAGVGCAGRGITRTLEIFDQANLLSPDRYDVVTFDLLGDVVCGGFAAPLSQRMGEKVVIVSSEEVMSLYAANNIAKAVVTYASGGIVCAGILLNLRDNDEDLQPAQRFAELLNTRIIGVIKREPLIREAEYRRITVVEHGPNAPITKQLCDLGEAILAVDPRDCPLPTPLSDQDFYAYSRHRFASPPGGDGRQRWVAGARGEGTATRVVRAAAAPPADDRRGAASRRAFKRDLKAGIAAVKRGLVSPAEALQRLQTSYPDFTRRLQARDLVT